MSKTKADARPPVHMIDSEADALSDLALSVAARSPGVSEMLLAEIERATVCTASEIPHDVVTMYSTVTFADAASGKERTMQLVYPADADVEADRISILTPIGAGLLGLRPGQSILWPDRDGNKRPLEIRQVVQPTAVRAA